jgi:c(7)-type cytochrome triheme protein
MKVNPKRVAAFGAAFFLIGLWIVFSDSCVRQEQKLAGLNVQAAPPPAVPVEAPNEEKQQSGGLPLTAPPPSEPKHESLTQVPVPGPPYGWQNRNPRVVLKNFPRDAIGTVDWVKAIKEGYVKPHDSLDLNAPPTPPFKFNVEIPAVGSMPNVIFPHEAHTLWLQCGNCHPDIFVMKKGANPISMVKIANGEFCGRCHGRISFPLANCTRCHVKPKP